MASFGEILCELRKDRHLTQKQLAEKMNVAVGTVSNYETGRHDPDLRALVWLADYFQRQNQQRYFRQLFGRTVHFRAYRRRGDETAVVIESEKPQADC